MLRGWLVTRQDANEMVLSGFGIAKSKPNPFNPPRKILQVSAGL
jgi:hypothetical protein